MKKYIVIALAAVVAFAACTKVNPDEKKTEKISFSVANYAPATKAYASILNEVGDNGFMSKAFLHASGVEEVQDFFGENGENITFKTNEWTPSRDYYWPKSPNSYLNFVSWYNTNEILTGSDADGYFSATEDRLDWHRCVISPATTPNANIMWADKAMYYGKNYTSAENNTAAGLTGAFGQDVSEGVPVLFHHALAKLTIKAKAKKVEAGTDGKKTSWDITLKNVKLLNYHKMGDLLLVASRPTTQTAQIVGYRGNSVVSKVWVPTGGEDYNGEVSIAYTGSALTTTATDVLAESSVLPQSLNPSTDVYVQLSFDADIVSKYNGTEYSHEVLPVTINLKTTDIPAWEMNTKYIYTIIIDPETEIIKFDPAAIAWETVTAPDITVTTL